MTVIEPDRPDCPTATATGTVNDDDIPTSAAAGVTGMSTAAPIVPASARPRARPLLERTVALLPSGAAAPLSPAWYNGAKCTGQPPEQPRWNMKSGHQRKNRWAREVVSSAPERTVERDLEAC
jgi:hypothetical protein